MDLPQFQSHKIVSAAKILAIVDEPNTFGYTLDLGPHGKHVVDWEWLQKRANVKDDDDAKVVLGGYLVIYADGYQSFSPAKAFEEGYTPVVVLTEGDAAADLAGTPRPDNPSVFIQPAIVGYRQLGETDADLMNEVKTVIGDTVQQALLQVTQHIAKQRHAAKLANNSAEGMRIDDAQPERWAAIARTHFQEGLTALTRAIAQPSSF